MSYGSLSGTAVDARSKTPVSQATVTIGERITKTADGLFFLDRLTSGTYMIHVEAGGYQPFNDEIEIGSTQVTMNIELQPADAIVQGSDANGAGTVTEEEGTVPVPSSEQGTGTELDNAAPSGPVDQGSSYDPGSDGNTPGPSDGAQTEPVGNDNGTTGSGTPSQSDGGAVSTTPAIAEPIPGYKPFTEAETAMADQLIEDLRQLSITVPKWVEDRSEAILFARLVNAEAGAESYDGKIAVAATVLARLNSPFYPDTIAGVILQVVDGKYYQYSPVLDGRINLTATKAAFNAVRDALAGMDPSNGGNGFYNPDKTTNAWVKSQPVTAVIGGHVFFRYTQLGSLYVPNADLLR